MKERGCSMSASMIRAYFAGLKGETRRAMKKQPHPSVEQMRPNPARVGRWQFKFKDANTWDDYGPQVSCPYGTPGDELYFKEHWRAGLGWDGVPPSQITGSDELLSAGLASGIWYESDGTWNDDARQPGARTRVGKLRQGRFMCRWMSRFRHIPITGIRAERLGDISEQAAIDEGIENWCPFGACNGGGLIDTGNTFIEPTVCRCSSLNAREVYRHLWEHIHGPASWERDKTKWVWVIEFPKYKKP